MVPHHVFLAKKVEGDAVHVLQYIYSFQQAALAGVGQVDLRDIAGDHSLGVEAHAGHEHLHLLRCGVLRLVENDKRII